MKKITDTTAEQLDRAVVAVCKAKVHVLPSDVVAHVAKSPEFMEWVTLSLEAHQQPDPETVAALVGMPNAKFAFEVAKIGSTMTVGVEIGWELALIVLLPYLRRSEAVLTVMTEWWAESPEPVVPPTPIHEGVKLLLALLRELLEGSQLPGNYQGKSA